MKLKLYTIASLVLIIATAVYSYYFFGEEMITHKVYNTEFTLPQYIWVIVPMTVLFIASFLHMLFYGFKIKMQLGRWKKDSMNLVDTLNAALVGKSKNLTIKHEELSQVAKVVKDAVIRVDKEFSDLNGSKLYDNLLKNRSIATGTYVQLPKSSYDKDNPLILQNLKNRLQNDEDFSKQVVKNADNYDMSIVEKALRKYAAIAGEKELKNTLEQMPKPAIDTVLERALQKAIEVDEPMADLLAKKIERSQVYSYAQVLQTHFYPDTVLAKLESLSREEGMFLPAYVYMLLEFEMIEKAGDILAENEGMDNFRAYLDLLECNKRYELKMFLRS
ncbi:MAG: hypothetical protein ACQERK_03280 [Campylobacterota bacterium]